MHGVEDPGIQSQAAATQGDEWQGNSTLHLLPNVKSTPLPSPCSSLSRNLPIRPVSTSVMPDTSLTSNVGNLVLDNEIVDNYQSRVWLCTSLKISSTMFRPEVWTNLYDLNELLDSRVCSAAWEVHDLCSLSYFINHSFPLSLSSRSFWLLLSQHEHETFSLTSKTIQSFLEMLSV